MKHTTVFYKHRSTIKASGILLGLRLVWFIMIMKIINTFVYLIIYYLGTLTEEKFNRR